ncbi:Hypothetical predicted protein [Lecanosticta acicola]|uniref:GA4 desaturase family protein n=1 Tax=Lecanosticta acicola TaxID=111012 RepID=A0AAI8YY96_9PEZI|nr:Hypothetical predicted protein [Lecanosticta acicola]
MDSPSPSIETIVNYYLPPPDNGPPPIYNVATAGSRRMKFDARRRTITDIRGREKDFHLDTHGFQYVTDFPSAETAFDDDGRIKTVVYREVEKMLKKATGATTVFIFSHIIRRDPLSKALNIPKEIDDQEIVRVAAPAWFAHVDQSYDGAWIALDSISRRDPDPSAKFLKSMARDCRWGIINVWRPIRHVTREPLAVCDASSVLESDLQEMTLRPPRDVSAAADDGDDPAADNDNAVQPAGRHSAYMNYGRKVPGQAPDQKFWVLRPNDRHRWYWPSEMTPSEALLIKCFDSRTDGRARRAPHSAIVTPGDHGPPRQSIELRCLVFWEHEALERDEDERARL